MEPDNGLIQIGIIQIEYRKLPVVQLESMKHKLLLAKVQLLQLILLELQITGSLLKLWQQLQLEYKII